LKNNLYKCVWYEYPTGNRAYGGGGWSRYAKHRPAPERVEVITSNVKFERGTDYKLTIVPGFTKSIKRAVYVNGQKKLKLNIYFYRNGQALREDYSDLSCGNTLKQDSVLKRKLTIQKKKEATLLLKKEGIQVLKPNPTMTFQDEICQKWKNEGSLHPCPDYVLQKKKESGMGWKDFTKSIQV